MRRLLWLVLVLACNLDPLEPGSALFVPAPIYRRWYAEAEACSGLRGNYDAIHFQTAEAISKGNRQFDGYWTPPHTITFRRDWVLDDRWGRETELLAKHEFMHDLTQSGSHPVRYFNGVCGNLYP